MGNELIAEHDERIRSYFQALERLSKALETLFPKRKSSLDGESFYTDEELSQRLKISRRSLQDYRNQGRISYIKLGGKILYRSSDVERMLEEGFTANKKRVNIQGIGKYICFFYFYEEIYVMNLWRV